MCYNYEVINFISTNNMFYRGILHQALKLTWKNKYLWFFGLFAAALGNTGAFNIFMRTFTGDSGAGFSEFWAGVKETGLLSGQGVTGFVAAFREFPLAMTVVLFVSLLLLALVIFMVWLANVSQAALVNNAGLLIGKKGNETGISEGVVVGSRKFWPVFGLNLLTTAVVALVYFLISTSAWLFPSGFILTNIFYGATFVVLLSCVMAFSFLVKYSIAYVVLRNKGLSEALLDGWRLFKNNWLISLEMAFVLFFINFVVTIVILVTITAMAIPFALLFYVLFNSGFVFGFMVVLAIGLLFYVSMAVLGGSILSTFQISAWTGLFMELESTGGVSKLVRVFNKK
jgi:hypothetical protein